MLLRLALLAALVLGGAARDLKAAAKPSPSPSPLLAACPAFSLDGLKRVALAKSSGAAAAGCWCGPPLGAELHCR